MKEPNELEDVLSEAVESYLICQIRNCARGRWPGDLSKEYPKHFRKMPNGKFRWIGTTADEIIEAYLAGYGYRQGSRLWHILCDIISRRAKHESG